MTAGKGWVRDGVAVGLIAYAAVAVFYSAFDLLAARGALFTVNLLGQALFHGLRDPSVLQFPTTPDLTVVFWYNALHLSMSLIIGLAVVWLVELAERQPERAGLVVASIAAGFFVTIIVVGYLTTPLELLLPLWSIVVANVAATVCAGAYLLLRRPGLWGRLMP